MRIISAENVIFSAKTREKTKFDCSLLCNVTVQAKHKTFYYSNLYTMSPLKLIYATFSVQFTHIN